MGKIDKVFVSSAVHGRVFDRLTASKRQLVKMAFDEASTTEASDVAAKVVEYLKPRLSREELQAVVQALKEAIGSPAMDNDPAFQQWAEENLGIPNPNNVQAGRSGGALQEGSTWNGKSSGQTLAADAAHLSQFPHANRLSAPGALERPMRPLPYMTPKEREELEKSFPHANRLK